MRHFQIENAYEPKDVGCFPQSTKMGCDYNHTRQDSIDRVNVNEIPSFMPFTGCFVLQQKALLTDFISSAILPTGFIVNEKVKNLITQFNLGEHAFFPTKITHRAKTYENYYWLILQPKDLTPYIDFNLSVFYLTDFNGLIKNELHFKSSPELKKAIKQISEETNGRDKIQSPNLYLKNDIQEFDLFELPISPYDLLVSEKLYSELVYNNITGIKLNQKLYLNYNNL